MTNCSVAKLQRKKWDINLLQTIMLTNTSSVGSQQLFSSLRYVRDDGNGRIE
ncbi:hypothetical protein C900_01338 [Fulvivirga imtechensis AK7]|uniref:Uncharacterized protein n=1 Tax=Fulvivirga imtechensis AK7 TaxID=1237149 RepID=L8K003_9BACT|nr:hypothetical protein C900_01338 [Fulvivirga imtechensis AK7]